MDAQTYPLADILKPERRFMIPTFQRDYEWGEDPQWRLLFEDLEAVGERLVDCRQRAAQTGAPALESDVSPHFLGAIVCDSLPFATGSVALRAVIDGQQRLSTLQLLIRGLLDVVQERDADGTFRKEAASLRRMLRNPEDVADVPEETYKLWPRRLDREVWPTAIGDDIPAEDHHLYLQARRFFAEAARTSLSSWPVEEADERLRAMVDALSGLFKLVVIDLDPNDDAQVIFEVLNGRQTPLSAADLVKNLLFLRGELNDDEVERLYDTYWADFDQAWWKTQVGTGHAARGRRDVLLSVWLNVETGRDVSVAHLYREARAFIDTDRPKTEAVLMDLADLARGYKEVYGEEPVADPRLRTAYDRLIRLNNLTAIPLLTWLRTLPPDQLSPEGHRAAAVAIESFTVRRMMVGWQTRGYGQIFTRALRDARAAAKEGQDIPAAIITSLSEGWPSDQDLQDAFLNRTYYGSVAQFRLRLVFAAIDDHMRSENPLVPNAAYEYDGLEIEHVMPQSWQDHWPLELDTDDEAARIRAEDERNARIHRLGNLTMVTDSFNKTVSNLSWSDHKRPEFAKQASLEINKPIAATNDWDENAIDARARELAQTAVQIWPPPDAPVSDDGSHTESTTTPIGVDNSATQHDPAPTSGTPEPATATADPPIGERPTRPVMCPLCTNDDDVVLLETLPDGRDRVECRACDYTWDYRETAPEAPRRVAGATGSVTGAHSGAAERYERVVGPVDGHNTDGTEIRLELKRRISAKLGRSWHTLTWRTRYEPGGQNRRFYSVGGQLWTMPAREALRMLEEMEELGGFDEAYHEEPRAPQHVYRSADLGPDERRRRMDEITRPDETWSPDARFVFTEGGMWRKIMIVESTKNLVTFRSTTTDPSYGMRIHLRDGVEWALDNAMQDTHTWQGRLFLEELRSIYQGGAG